MKHFARGLLPAVVETPLQRATANLATINMAMYRLTFVSQSVFFVAFLAAFGASNARTSTVFTLMAIMHVVFTLAVGALCARVNAITIITWGSVVFAAGAFSSAVAPSLTVLTITFGVLIAAGSTMIGLVPTASLISSEFSHGRGQVFGAALFVAAIVSFVGVPLIQLTNQVASWRVSLMALGGVVLVVPVTVRELQRRKFDTRSCAQVRPSGPGVLMGASSLPNRHTLRSWLADPPFRYLLLAHSQIGIAIGAVLVPLVANLTERGLTATQGSIALALVVLFTAVGALGGGRLSDWLGREIAYSVASMLRVVGLAALLFVESGRPWLLVMFVVAYGLGWGSTGPVEIAIVSDFYHHSRLAPRLGVLEAVTSGFYAMSIFVVSLLRDRTGTYDAGVAIAGLASVLTACAYWVAGPRHYAYGVRSEPLS